jgi:hypothetical protein
MSAVQLHQVADLFAVPVNLRRHTVDGILFLVLIDGIKEIAVGKKICIDQPIIRHIILVHPVHLHHVVIEDRDPVFIPHVFIDQEIAIDLPDDLEVYATDIFFFGFRINYFLGKTQGCRQTNECEQKQLPGEHKRLNFYLLKLKVERQNWSFYFGYDVISLLITR